MSDQFVATAVYNFGLKRLNVQKRLSKNELSVRVWHKSNLDPVH